MDIKRLIIRGLIVLSVVGITYGLVGILSCLVLSYFNILNFTLMNTVMLGLGISIITFLLRGNITIRYNDEN